MYCGTVVNDGVKWQATTTYDHRHDAELLLKRLDAQDGAGGGDVEEEFSYTPQPDEQLNLDKGTGSVLCQHVLEWGGEAPGCLLPSGCTKCYRFDVR